MYPRQIKPSDVEEGMVGFVTLQLALETLENSNFEGNQKANRKNLESALRELEPVLNRVFNANKENAAQRQLWVNYRNASRELERHLSVSGKITKPVLTGLRVCHAAAAEWVEQTEVSEQLDPKLVIDQYEDLVNRMYDLILISLRASNHPLESKIDAALNRLIEKYNLK